MTPDLTRRDLLAAFAAARLASLPLPDFAAAEDEPLPSMLIHHFKLMIEERESLGLTATQHRALADAVAEHDKIIWFP